MKYKRNSIGFVVVTAVIFLCFLSCIFICNYGVAVIYNSTPILNRKTVIIDAGHGGVDGGATSCTGVLESKLNLDIALRLDDLLHLLGIKTKMIRRTDCSVYTEGTSIAAKKVSDLKERVRIINATENAAVISIHQNYFSQSQYSGAQVFYANSSGSKEFASLLQANIASGLMPENKRQIKNTKGIYLMEHIQCPGVLIECGFLSNPEEEARLRDAEYQKKICCIIAATCSKYLSVDPL